MDSLRSTKLLCELAEVLPGGLRYTNEAPSLHCMIDILDHALLAVRKQCNLTSAAYKLPREIILFIIDLVRHDTARDAGHATVELSAAGNRSLVSLTHVCHRWRAVALGCPVIWTGILSRSSSAETFVQRACDMPLSVVTEVVGGRLSKPTMRLLWRLRARTQFLHIVVEFLPQLHIFRKMLGRLSSTLLSLTIVVLSSRRMRPDRLEKVYFLFGGSAPHLRSLSISSPDPFIPIDHFPTLTDLHLSKCNHARISTELSQILRRTPTLETVHVHLRLQVAISLLPFNTGTPIAFPKLRRFCVTSLPRYPREANLVYTILSHVVIPPNAMVTVQEVPSYSLPGGVYRLYAPLVGPQPRSVVTVDDTGTVITTRGGSSTFTITYQERITAVKIMSPFGMWPADDHLEGSKGLLSTVTLLRLQGASSWRWSVRDYGTALSRLVAGMPLLTALVIRDFSREMLPQLTHLLENIGDTVLCPLLDTVTFITLDITVSQPEAQELLVEPTLNILLRATARRAERGCPITRFTFCSPYIEQEHTLHNAYGVEQFSVLCRDVWSECSEGVDHETAAHWEDVGRDSPQQERGRTRGYDALWKRHVDRDPPVRGFGACGHGRRWP